MSTIVSKISVRLLLAVTFFPFGVGSAKWFINQLERS